MRFIFTILFFVFIAVSCSEEKRADTLFTKMEPAHTNIHFTNKLAYEKDFNIYTYRNFYNGGGVAIGDINNDSLPDIFFTSNQHKNRLYLNKGNLHFEDI